MTDSLLQLNPARRTILLVTALLVLPFAVAFGLYWLDWRPDKLGNYGEFITPPLVLPVSGLVHADGRPMSPSEWHGKWTLLRIGKAVCDTECENDLHQMRQVQVAQNKEMLRLRRVLLGESPSPLAADPATIELRRKYPDLVIIAPLSSHEGEHWRAALNSTDYRFYVIDPLGNAIMRYSDKPDMQGMRKDIERLLKYSWVG